MEFVLATVAVLANLITSGRLIFYRRGDSRYKPLMSFLAWVLIVSAGGQVIDIVFNGAIVTPSETAFAAVIAVLSVRARGNVAAMVRCRA